MKKRDIQIVLLIIVIAFLCLVGYKFFVEESADSNYVVIENRYIFFYLPVLLISAVITGIVTGIIAKNVLKSLSTTNVSTYIQ